MAPLAESCPPCGTAIGVREVQAAGSIELSAPMLGLYKTELVHYEGPWRGLDDLELATLSC